MNAIGGGLARLASNAGRVARLAARTGLRRQARAAGMWLDVPVGPGLSELAAPSWGRRSPTLGLFDLLRSLDTARHDPRVIGVVLLFCGDLQGFSKVLALRRALCALRDSGKHVLAWGESFSVPQYLLASAAEKVWLPPSGTLHLIGLRTEQFYLRDLLARIDVRPELVRIGSYKTGGEMMTRDGMSPESREQLEGWQGDVFEALVEGIAAGRGIEAAAVRELIDRGPYPAGAAEQAGLTDGCLYPDELDDQLQALASSRSEDGSADAPLRIPVSRYFAIEACDAGWQPLLHDLPRVAYVVASGIIRRGRGQRGITSGGFEALLKEIRERDSVRGVVLRIDSPGGDAVASDLLHRAVEILAEQKAVVISMGDVAASGGYYIAAAGHRVLAEAATLTGSIGVFGGKLNLEGLYRKLGIAKDAVEHGARAGLFSESRDFSPDERAAVRDEMQSIYDVFVSRVARGRHMALEDVKRVAEGRIFSGERARTVGLVDQIGGPLESVREVCKRAGIAEGDRFVLEVLPRSGRFSAITDLLGGAA